MCLTVQISQLCMLQDKLENTEVKQRLFPTSVCLSSLPSTGRNFHVRITTHMNLRGDETWWVAPLDKPSPEFVLCVHKWIGFMCDPQVSEPWLRGNRDCESLKNLQSVWSLHWKILSWVSVWACHGWKVRPASGKFAQWVKYLWVPRNRRAGLLDALARVWIPANRPNAFWYLLQRIRWPNKGRKMSRNRADAHWLPFKTKTKLEIEATWLLSRTRAKRFLYFFLQQEVSARHGRSTHWVRKELQCTKSQSLCVKTGNFLASCKYSLSGEHSYLCEVPLGRSTMW